jgi:hypothetical protein
VEVNKFAFSRGKSSAIGFFLLVSAFFTDFSSFFAGCSACTPLSFGRPPSDDGCNAKLNPVTAVGVSSRYSHL